MCNLYKMSHSAAEIARLFNAESATNANTLTMIYPASNGLVVTDGVRSMVWGFPLVLRSKKTGEPVKPKPVNNARTEKLDGRFWSASFRERRCLIPVEAFAEAQGKRGSMTRTWFSDPGAAMLTCAGIWRDSAEWGPVYSMIMTEANEQVAPTHDRMPVLLSDTDRARYLYGSENDAKSLCRPFAGELLVDATDEPWTKHY